MSDLDSSFVIRYENSDGEPVYVIENSEGLVEFANINEGLDCLATISSLSNGELAPLVSIDSVENNVQDEEEVPSVSNTPILVNNSEELLLPDLPGEEANEVEQLSVQDGPEFSESQDFTVEEVMGSGGEYVEIQEVVEEEVIAEGSQHDQSETPVLDDQDLIQDFLSFRPGMGDSLTLAENDPLGLPPIVSPVYPCDTCGEKFTKKLHLMNHMITHQSDHPHTCYKCSITFSRRSEFNTHMKIHAMENNDQLNFLNDFDEEMCRFSRRKRNNSTRSNTSTSSTTRRRYTYSNSSSTSSRKRKHSTRLDDTFELDMLIKSAEKSARTSENRLKWPITNDAKPYVCQTCGLGFGREKALLNHNRIHAGDTPHECGICGESFSSVTSLRDHTRARHFTSFLTSPRGDLIKSDGGDGALLPPHEQYGDFPCHICGQMYYRLDQFQRHERTHQPVAVEDSESRDTDECPQVCKHCGMYFEHEDELRDHAKLHQGPLDPGLSSGTANDFINRCIVCNEYFGSTELAVAHMREVHGDELLDNICTICNQQFASESLLLSHDCDGAAASNGVGAASDSNDVSPVSTPALSGEKRKAPVYRCYDCPETFSSRAKLKRHGTAEHKVPTQSKPPSSASSKKSPAGGQQAPRSSRVPAPTSSSCMCDECGEEYPDRAGLLEHQARHNVIPTERGRIFPCHDCGKLFNSRSSQQIHQRVHTGEKPYSCRFCYKAFADGGTLRKHERVHTGEKPYVCPICNKAFNQRVVMREHVRAHHSGPEVKGSPLFQCKVCAAMLGSGPELCQHLVRHSDENTARNRVVPTAPRKYKRRRKLLPHEGDGFPDTDEDEESGGPGGPNPLSSDGDTSTLPGVPPRKPTPEYDREFLEWEMKVGISSIDKASSPLKSKAAPARKQATRRSHRSYASKYYVSRPPSPSPPSLESTLESASSSARTSAGAAPDGLISLSSLAQVIAERDRGHTSPSPSLDSTHTSARTLGTPPVSSGLSSTPGEDTEGGDGALVRQGRAKRQYRRKALHSRVNVDLNQETTEKHSSAIDSTDPLSILDQIKEEIESAENSDLESCSISFVQETIETTTHLESGGAEGFLTCDMCSEVFVDREELMSHIRIHVS